MHQLHVIPAMEDYETHQIDIKGTYLNGILTSNRGHLQVHETITQLQPSHLESRPQAQKYRPYPLAVGPEPSEMRMIMQLLVQM